MNSARLQVIRVYKKKSIVFLIDTIKQLKSKIMIIFYEISINKQVKTLEISLIKFGKCIFVESCKTLLKLKKT